ncbi:regulator of G protein signaling superfamily [Backusella circina FSU 941]|nr:regulator of G protein signaling superfamily [Backusella circina FSU 941]
MFSAVMLQIELIDHRVLFRSYPYTFTTDEVAKVLTCLKFIYIARSPDPEDPSRQIATRTTTTFSMEFSSAKNLLQEFLSARLVKNATDPDNWQVKDKGIWSPTLKGKHVIEGFAKDTQMKISERLKTALDSPSISDGPSGRLIVLDRLTENDDQLTFSRPNMTAAFSAMLANLPTDELMVDDVGGLEKRNLAQYEHTYMGYHCIEWLCAKLTVSNREEAEMVASEFVVFGWLAQVVDKSDKNSSRKDEDTTFKSSRNAIYYITDRGCHIVGWKTSGDDSTYSASDLSLASNSSSSKKTLPERKFHGLIEEEEEEDGLVEITQGMSTMNMFDKVQYGMTRHDSATDLVTSTNSSTPELRPPSMTLTDSNTSHSSSISPLQSKDASQWAKLHYILEIPLLRMYFRDFLRANYCVENLDFWVYHGHLLKSLRDESKTVLEQLSECYSIYETYIGPNATADVNIDYALIHDFVGYVDSVFTLTSKVPTSESNMTYFIVPNSSTQQPKVPNSSARLLMIPPQMDTSTHVVILGKNVSPERCLIKLLKLLGRVNEHVCRIMAEDSLPKFTKTAKYKELLLIHEQQKDDVTYTFSSTEDQRHHTDITEA